MSQQRGGYMVEGFVIQMSQKVVNYDTIFGHENLGYADILQQLFLQQLCLFIYTGVSWKLRVGFFFFFSLTRSLIVCFCKDYDRTRIVISFLQYSNIQDLVSNFTIKKNTFLKIEI
eukprot:TRINITY_DN1321_c0_g1_i1.p5 TRINITY_DN1321_c0_g1~~TRINITY_DN1321_c0_g1_i1.p5  ORF type:complete len:116 (-),score=5.23 TRINITY_DN1321_c0_g1_i1:1046-1393(-)